MSAYERLKSCSRLAALLRAGSWETRLEAAGLADQIARVLRLLEIDRLHTAQHLTTVSAKIAQVDRRALTPADAELLEQALAAVRMLRTLYAERKEPLE